MNSLQNPIDASTWCERQNDRLSQLGKRLLESPTPENFRIFDQVATQIINLINQSPENMISVVNQYFIKNKIMRYRMKYHLRIRLQRLSSLYGDTYHQISQYAKPLMALSMLELDQLLDQLLIRSNKYISWSLNRGILMRVPLDLNLTKFTTDYYLFICPLSWCPSCQKFELSDFITECSICSSLLSNDFYRDRWGNCDYSGVPKFNRVKITTYPYLSATLVCMSEKNFINPPKDIDYRYFDPKKVLQHKVINNEGRSDWDERCQILIRKGLIPQLILDKIKQYDYIGNALYTYLKNL